MHTYRGDVFRPEFGKLGEIRSIFPENVHLMALTATATNSTRAAVIKTLDMQSPTIVSVYPDKKNILYYVAEKSSISESFAPIVSKLSQVRSKMDKVIIFCRTYDQVTAIYGHFKRQLGTGFTEPPGAPDIMQCRLVDMFTHCTHKSVKDSVLQNFKEDSSLRIVIATVAFGMGVDCPDIRQIIHWGVPEDMETFIQETGRAGRDGKPSCSLMLYSKRDLNKKHTSEQIIEYCKNDSRQCGRELIFADFDKHQLVATPSSGTGCMCCWICRSSCKCGQCDLNLINFFI